MEPIVQLVGLAGTCLASLIQIPEHVEVDRRVVDYFGRDVRPC